MPESVATVAGSVEALVAKGRLPGSRLAVLLREAIPEWTPSDYEVGSLKEFVAKFVPNVVVAGRSGMDLLYGIRDSTSNPAPPLSETVDYWRIWVSPRSPLSIAVVRDDLRLRSVARSLSTRPGEALLVSPGMEAHRKIAETFLSAVPERDRPALETRLRSDSEQWWQAWNREVSGAGLTEAWSKFRHEKLGNLLEESLLSAGFDGEAVTRISTTIRHLRSIGAHRLVDGRSASEGSPERELLLQVITKALNRLTTDELRALRIPVGVVIETLMQRKYP